MSPAPFDTVLREALAARPGARREAAGATAAAVLAALYEGPAGEPMVWLLRRPETLRRHSGQVALPGGKRDPEDRDLVATALREAHEEIGLPPAAVEVLGIDDDLVTGTGFVITPVIGRIDARFEPVPNAAEVARVFSAPLASFRDGALVRSIPFPALQRMVRAYPIDGEIVWGATAAILSALAARLG